MASKYQLTHSNFYIANSDIPINILEINDSKVIHELERSLLVEGYEIFSTELKSNMLFDEKYFKSLQKRTFESLYEWAGEYRSFNMAKGESRFCQGAYINNQAKILFDNLIEDEVLKNPIDKREFASRLAYHKCELIALHPFPELNGRTTRMFFDMIAYCRGYSFIDYSKITSTQYIDASIECVQYANCESFEKIIFDGLKIERRTIK